MFQVIVVFLHKGAITKVILKCDLNAMELIFAWRCQIR